MIIRYYLSLCFLGIALAGAIYYPILNFPLVCGVLGLFIVLIRFPLFGLFFIPAFLPVVNLAPWSGYLLYEEFDPFLLAIVGAGIWKGFYSYAFVQKKNRLIRIGIIVFSLSIFISFLKVLFPLSPIQSNDFSNYLSEYNSFRVGRSFLWAMFLFPFLKYCFSMGNKAAWKNLILGFVIGVVGVCCVTFWERGIINDILHASNRYDLLRNLLDFSSEYRITALFSEMNTGGSAIDGYIALAWVFPFGFYVQWLRSSEKWTWDIRHIAGGCLAICALFSGLYIIATTFTRITYIAFAVSCMIFAIGLLISKHPGKQERFWGGYAIPFIVIVTFSLLLYFSYIRGGFLALFSGAFVIAGGIFVGIGSLYFPVVISICGALLIFSSGTAIMAKAIGTSKWVETGLFETWIFSVVSAWILFSISTGTGRWFANKKKIVGFIGLLIPLMVLLAVSIPMISGNRMQTRFAESGRDAETRFGHWSNVLKVMDKKPLSIIAGMGLGSFPRNFIKKNQQAQNLGIYAYNKEYGNTYLVLSGGRDMEIGQRILKNDNNGRKFTLKFKARTNKTNSILSVRICIRNLLHAAGCEYYNVKLNDNLTGQWMQYQINIKERGIKKYKWYSTWPQVLLISNSKKGNRIEVDNISLVGENGKNIIKNGNFEKGGQRWFSYNEFEHLPWHTKNIWLHLLFEQGVLGVIGFLLMAASAGWKSLQGAIKGSVESLTLFSAMIGFLIIGITGSLLDAPRVAFLYYIVVFSALNMDTELKV